MRLTALLMALMLAFGSFSLSASASKPTENIFLNDILKVKTDPANNKLYTLGVYYNVRFKNFNPDYPILLLDKWDNPVAMGIPRTGDEFIVDFFDMKQNAGVTLKLGMMYTVYIQTGTFYSLDGYDSAACSRKLTGATLTGNDNNYTIKDLGITSYLSTSYNQTTAVLSKGKITFNKDFTSLDSSQFDVKYAQKKDKDGKDVTVLAINPALHGIRLEKKTSVDGKTVWVTVACANVTKLDNGTAEFEFWSFNEIDVKVIKDGLEVKDENGKVKTEKALVKVDGVTIDKYATYRLAVDYGALYNADKNLFCDDTFYQLTGKKLLGMSEKYPFIDVLIDLFGKDNFMITAILFVLEWVGKINADTDALYKDLKAYIDAK